MLQLIISAIQAVLQVMVIVFFGFCLTKKGYFNMEKQKWLSKVNMVFFTPCLLFTNIAATISWEKLFAFWPIPCFYIVFAALCFVLSQVTTRVVGLSAAYRRFVLACVMFGNTNSLPIAIISSLAVSEAGKVLFWNADDSQEAVAARGISYTLFFAIFGNLVRWSYGYSLLSKHDEDEEEEDDSTTIGQTTPPTSYGTIHASNNNYDIEQARPSGMPDRRYSSMTLAAQPDDSKSSATTPVNEATTLLLPKLDSVEEQPGLLTRIARKVNGFMSPPLYAACLALLVGLSPLKHLLYDKQWLLYPCLTKAIETCGKAAVPIILTCLGAQLTCIWQSQQPTSPAIKKPVNTVMLVRFVLMPFFVVPIVVAFVHFGSQWSTLATDPVFAIMMIVLGCSPTAINLVQITQVNGIFEEEMLRMLFYSYGIVCVPLCTALVFIGLSVVDKLL